MSLPKLPLYRNAEIHTLIGESIQSHSTGVDSIEILEAGCGRHWPIDLGNVNYRITGIDMDEQALKSRVEGRKDLHEAIVGDLRTVDLPSKQFDVVYCSFVLEHVQDSGIILKRFLRWVKPGGLIVVKVPDRNSVYGFITRMTPFWFHVFYKRRLLGNPTAGTLGHGPYPTYHEKAISRRSLGGFAQSNKLEVVRECGFGVLGGWEKAVAKTVSALSLGSLSAEHSDLLMVLKAPADATVRPSVDVAPFR